MQYVYDGVFFKAVKITGPKHNLLSLSLGESNDITVTKLGDEAVSCIESNDVLRQVKEGLNDINIELGTNYSINEIQFVCSDTPSGNIYNELTKKIILRIHEDGEFSRV